MMALFTEMAGILSTVSKDNVGKREKKIFKVSIITHSFFYEQGK